MGFDQEKDVDAAASLSKMIISRLVDLEADPLVATIALSAAHDYFFALTRISQVRRELGMDKVEEG